jgi:hypothetical protein
MGITLPLPGQRAHQSEQGSHEGGELYWKSLTSITVLPSGISRPGWVRVLCTRPGKPHNHRHSCAPQNFEPPVPSAASPLLLLIRVLPTVRSPWERHNLQSMSAVWCHLGQRQRLEMDVCLVWQKRWLGSVVLRAPLPGDWLGVHWGP